MTDIWGTINIGANALMLQQKGINVAGNNIANVNTPGYSRQRMLTETNSPLTTHIGPIGNGVRVAGIERVYDQFVGVQLNNEKASQGRWEAQKNNLDQVEIVLNESGGYGLNQTLSEFWDAWQDVAMNPSGTTERKVLVTRGQILSDKFNKNYADLERIQENVNRSIENSLDEINRLTAEIAELNVKIGKVEASGMDANDYRDTRDLTLKELAGLIDIDTYENSDGHVAVRTSGGRPLVESAHTWNLVSTPDANGMAQIYWPTDSGGSTNITGEISAGKIKGWLEIRDTNIAGYRTRLDDMAQALMDGVNGLHSAGADLDGNTGTDFFTNTGGATAASGIEVNADVIGNTNLIAAALDPSGSPGDNGNAILIADLQQSLTMNGGTATFDDFYNGLVSDVGHDVQQAGSCHSYQTDMVTYLENYRESISGVSIDEEMINLVKYQAAYDAAAKLISIADELMQTVLSIAR